MSGIYLHIPFCKQACHYCNFHFSTSLRQKTPLLAALKREASLQAHFLPPSQAVETIYIGGGTPSLLSAFELNDLLEHLFGIFTIADKPEITLEANPDDLLPEKIAELRHYTPINRLSIGIQSFFDADLLFMNRAHSANQAQQCLENAQNAGFDDLSIDLIYGTPTLGAEQWEQNLMRAFTLGIPHLSAYCLTVEPRTALAQMVKTGKAMPVADEYAAQHFASLVQMTKEAGYEHYEISNFCLPNRHSRHNSGYWAGTPYLGLGPAAHSFDGTTRQWNIANNAAYIRAITTDQIPAEREQLSTAQRFNEYVMTSLRTMWGCQLPIIEQRFGAAFRAHTQAIAPKFIAQELMTQNDHTLTLSNKGKFLADGIISDFMVTGADVDLFVQT